MPFQEISIKTTIMTFEQKSFDQRTIQFDLCCLLRLFWSFSRKTYFLISSMSSIKFWWKDNTVWPLSYCLWRGSWILLILKFSISTVYYSATYTSFFIPCHSCLKLSQTNVREFASLCWTSSWNFSLKFLSMWFFTKRDGC